MALVEASLRRPAAVQAPSQAEAWRPTLEVIAREPPKARDAPPVLFVHGAWHGAWCWDEHFLSHFAANGFYAVAVSLRGHGASEGRERLQSNRIRDYVDDVAAVVDALPEPPILVGHSMGGFVVQKYLETRTAPLAVLMASLPPEGARRMMLSLARRRPVDLLRSNLTVSLWPLVSDPGRAHDVLFSRETPAERVAAYHSRMQDETLLGSLDSLFLDLVDPSRIATPIVVLGARHDAMVGVADVARAGRAYGVEPIFVERGGHAMMLDLGWRDAADAIIQQIDVSRLARSV